MIIKRVLLVLLVFIQISLQQMHFRYLETDAGLLKVRICLQDPKNAAPVGDVFYFHGFADRCDNHSPLFNEWANRGFRVISFDYPSHGETSGPLNEINLFPFTRLASLASKVEQSVRQANRPFILAGWSTGGLLAVRIAQRLNEFTRRVNGIVLQTPGVAVHALIGENGFVTVRTLTSNPNPPYRGPIKPTTPLKHPIFAGFLLANAHESNKDRMPLGIPTLVIVAGDTLDKYVKSPEIKSWIQSQSSQGVLIQGYQCGNSLHDTDNEREAIGGEVRTIIGEFTSKVIGGQNNFNSLMLKECQKL